jgi:hypothetical protein
VVRFVTVMNQLVCSAIRHRRAITFHYDGGRRLVEPYSHGASAAGHDLLRGYQLAGHSRSGLPEGWKTFRLDELSDLAMTDEVFAGDRPEYDPSREDMMATIYCRV